MAINVQLLVHFLYAGLNNLKQVVTSTKLKCSGMRFNSIYNPNAYEIFHPTNRHGNPKIIATAILINFPVVGK